MAYKEEQPIVIAAVWQHHSSTCLCRPDLSLPLLTDLKLVPCWQAKVSRETSESSRTLYSLSQGPYQWLLIFSVQHFLSSLKTLEGAQLPQSPWQHLELLCDLFHSFPTASPPIHVALGNSSSQGAAPGTLAEHMRGGAKVQQKHQEGSSAQKPNSDQHACLYRNHPVHVHSLQSMAPVLCPSSVRSKAEVAFNEVGNRKVETLKNDTSNAMWQAKCHLAGQVFFFFLKKNKPAHSMFLPSYTQFKIINYEVYNPCRPYHNKKNISL